MKIKEEFKKPTEPYYDNAGPYTIDLENDKGEKLSVYFSEGEPEDMTFSRDLSDVFNIPALLKFAYEAGKNGEELIIENN
jgi:hypothetical protein